MMGMRLSLSCALHIEEPYCETALPKLAKMLENLRYQEVLGVLMDVAPIRPDGFRTRIDWFLVMCLPDYRVHCDAFYNDDGPQLHELVSEDLRNKIDAFLCRCLESAAEAA